MRKILFIIGAILLLLACTKSKKAKDSVDITVSNCNNYPNDRNGKDYVILWVNDTLQFSDTFHVNYIASDRETWYEMFMKVATINKANRDSLKLRVRIVSLDSVLFAGHHAVDTTFRYSIDSVPYMNINYYRQLNYFRVKDTFKNKQAFYFE